MCIAIPAKVIEAKGGIGLVDFGEGVRREVNLLLVDAKVGDYVIVHAGMAIEVLDESEALETLKIFQEIARGGEKDA